MGQPKSKSRNRSHGRIQFTRSGSRATVMPGDGDRQTVKGAGDDAG
jgi:hypothetical protein